MTTSLAAPSPRNVILTAISAVIVTVVSVWAAYLVLNDAYYSFIFYPRAKGAEYTFPEYRYIFGQACILIWSLWGVATAGLLWLRVSGREHRWTSKAVKGFLAGFVLFAVGMVVGMSLRGTE